MKVDIVIPIYNAYEYTVECINSVFKYTNDENYNLILINDKSPDKRIEEYLQKLNNEKRSNVIVYSNEENLGFVGTVNRGMSLSNNDIILLNSDTEVTKGWLSKIRNAAYSNERIATVTPLTNSGTICSIPIFCEDNEIPEQFTIEQYADIVEKFSLKKYPSIPTGVGFCMYIKRKVIDEIGLFDAETFGKGYGEENDFCCRALENGYHHILCDDTFIFHKGSASFTESKKEFIENNLKILFDRYPYYPKMVEQFINKNLLKDIQENIKLQIKLRNNKKNVLYVLHNDFIKGLNHPIGGTEFHVKDIIENIDECNGYVMFLKENQIQLQAFIDKEIFKFEFELCDLISTFSFSLNDYKDKINHILDYFNIDFIHIHHFITHTFDLVDIAKEKNIPIMLTLHDFYLACPCVNFLYMDREYCENIRNSENCRKCIKNKYGYNTDYLEIWNQKVYDTLKKIDKLIAPSESAKNLFLEYYKNIFKESSLEIEVVEHGIDNEEDYVAKDENKNDKFKIAFIGGLAFNKGSGLINELISENKNKNIEWHMFGNIGDRKLNLLERNDVIKHGRYERNNIVRLLNKNNIDLICIFSIWPETYSYTLSEAITAKVPVIVTDIGALGERVRKYENGWTVKYNDSANNILAEIYKIIEDKEDYQRKLTKLKDLQLPSKKQVAEYYEKEYLKSPSRNYKYSDSPINKDMLLYYKISNIDFTSGEYGEASVLIRELNKKIEGIENEMNLMRSTFGWKVLEYLRNLLPDGIKKMGKKMIYSIIKIKR